MNYALLSSIVGGMLGPTAQLLLTCAPMVLDLVTKLEGHAPQPGAGAQKRDAVIAVVSAAVNAEPVAVGDARELAGAARAHDPVAFLQGVGAMVDHLVSFFNAAGIFKRASATPTAPAVASVAAPLALVPPSAAAAVVETPQAPANADSVPVRPDNIPADRGGFDAGGYYHQPLASD